MANKALMRSWVEALRSGDYSEATGFLKTDKGFDPLGVLCQISKPDGWTKTAKGFNQFNYKGDYSTYRLPDPLRAELGVADNFDYYMIELSDKKGLSHKDIATILETTYLGGP